MLVFPVSYKRRSMRRWGRLILRGNGSDEWNILQMEQIKQLEKSALFQQS